MAADHERRDELEIILIFIVGTVFGAVVVGVCWSLDAEEAKSVEKALRDQITQERIASLEMMERMVRNGSVSVFPPKS